MIPDGTLRRVRVARAHGVADRLVRAERDEALPRADERDGALLGQPRDDGLVNRGEDRVARYHGQHIVERDVGAFERLQVVQRVAVLVERAAQRAAIVVGRERGGVPREPNLEELPRLLEAADATGRRQQMARGAGEGFDDDLGGRLDNARAFAVAHGDESHLRQGEQRLSHGRAADTVALHEVAFRRKSIARSELPFLDQVLDSDGDVLIEATPANRRRPFRYTCHTSHAPTLGRGRGSIKKRIPDPIVGFDDHPMSRYTSSQHTTVRVPAEAMGRRAAEELP